MNSTYHCLNPVVLIIFNRPDQTAKILDILGKVKPAKLYVISDGPRKNNIDDDHSVNKCRSLIDSLSWQCDVFRNYSSSNLGCMRRILTGLDWVFHNEGQAIILEDDCLPTIDFFKFLDWGLNYYKDQINVGMISGANLIDYKTRDIKYRNGYSKYINIWGWGTWKRVWDSHDKYLNLKQINDEKIRIYRDQDLSFLESFFWIQIFKNVVYHGSTWDFQLQYTFFKKKYLSIYPSSNQVLNIGFDSKSTHTSFQTPTYVKLSKPKFSSNLMSLPICNDFRASRSRDYKLLKTIWKFSLFNTLRIYVMNLYRFIFG